MKKKFNVIYNEDCLTTMHRMKNNSIDLVVTSPPYDDLRSYGGYSFNFEKTAQELARILKIGGVIVWIVGDATIKGSESLTSFRQALYFKELGLTVHDTMIYQKNRFIHCNRNRYHSQFEFMFIISKGKPKTANLLYDRQNKSAGTKIHGTYRSREGKMLQKSGKGRVIRQFGPRGNIWPYDVGLHNSTKDLIAFKHPAICPEHLVRDHILTWTNETDVVYDPFSGSGTSGKMAKLLNRRFILSESNAEYIPIIQARLASKNLPPGMISVDELFARDKNQ